MDCSKTLNFVAEYNRMCSSYANCKGCPLDRSDVGCLDVQAFTNTMLDLVQKWSDGIKEKTYAMDFFEKFPSAPRKGDIPVVCRSDVYCVPCRTRKPTLADCVDCWKETVKENVK